MVKMTVMPKAIYRYNTIPIKVQVSFLKDTDKIMNIYGFIYDNNELYIVNHPIIWWYTNNLYINIESSINLKNTDEKADNTNEDDHKDSEDEKSDGSHNDDDHKESANKKSSDSNDDKEKSTDEKE